MSDATLTRLIRPTGSACVSHIMRSCRIRLLCLKCRMQRWRALSDLRGTHVLITSCVYVASGYCAQNVGCGADASYPTYRERMCWSHYAFMSHPATVPKISDATLTRLIRPTGNACVDHLMRSCCIRLLAQNVGCDADASYPTCGERIC